MSDFDVTIVAVDAVMDAVEAYQREFLDMCCHIRFDMQALFDMVSRKIRQIRAAIEDIHSQIDAALASQDAVGREPEAGSPGNAPLEDLYRRLHTSQAFLQDLEGVMAYCLDSGTDLLDRFTDLHTLCREQAGDALRFMGRYIHDLNLICNRQARSLGTYRSAEGYYVCVVDSALYPSTAEHIRMAQNRGHPARLTIDRQGAAQRRMTALQGTPVRSDFDRDEYPMALFTQGGEGADVAHLESPDNQGAGSFIGWQLRGVEDGAEVRIRVI